MFATRSSKSKKPKRRRVTEDDDAVGGADKGGQHPEHGEGGDEVVIAALSTDRRKINTFSTGTAKRAKNVIAEAQQFESERQIVPQKYAGDATYETQIDTARDRDARAVMERNIQVNADGTAEEESGKVYRGQAGYKNYVAKKESQIGMNKYTGTQGPIRAQTWARAISRFDYQPDICKDYKETGFCGYGDSCKFLHDRGDYKSGWQIEKEFAEKEKKRQKKMQQGLGSGGGAGADVDDDDEDDDKYVIHSDDEDEQFACTICRQPFRNAVETPCGHVFCEQCALKHFKKTSRCFNCRKQTNGVFKAAEKLRKQEQERREAEHDQEEDGVESDSNTGSDDN